MASLPRTLSCDLSRDPHGKRTERKGRPDTAHDKEDIVTGGMNGHGNEEDAMDDESDAGSEYEGLNELVGAKLEDEEYNELLARTRQDGHSSLTGVDLLRLLEHQSQIQHDLQNAVGAYLLTPRAGHGVIADITKVLGGTIIWTGDAVRKMNRTLKIGDPHVLPSHNGTISDKFRPAMFFNHINGKSIGYTLHRYSKRGLGALTKKGLRSGVLVAVINHDDPVPVYPDVPNLRVLRVVGGNRLATPCVMNMIEKELFITEKSRITATTLHPDDYDEFLAARDAYLNTGNSDFSAAASIAKVRHAQQLGDLTTSSTKGANGYGESDVRQGEGDKEVEYDNDLADCEAERAEEHRSPFGSISSPNLHSAPRDAMTSEVTAQDQHQSHDDVRASTNTSNIRIHNQSMGGNLNVITGDNNKVIANDSAPTDAMISEVTAQDQHQSHDDVRAIPNTSNIRIQNQATGGNVIVITGNNNTIIVNDSPRSSHVSEQRLSTSSGVGVQIDRPQFYQSRAMDAVATDANGGLRAELNAASTDPTLQPNKVPLASMVSGLSHQTLGAGTGGSKRDREEDDTLPRSIRARMNSQRDGPHGSWDGRVDASIGEDEEDSPRDIPKPSRKIGRHIQNSKTREQFDDELDQMTGEP